MSLLLLWALYGGGSGQELRRSSQPSSLPEADFGSRSASESSDPGTGHTNFHCNVYLETRERKGLRFSLARGTP